KPARKTIDGGRFGHLSELFSQLNAITHASERAWLSTDNLNGHIDTSLKQTILRLRNAHCSMYGFLWRRLCPVRLCSCTLHERNFAPPCEFPPCGWLFCVKGKSCSMSSGTWVIRLHQRD